MFKLTPGFSHRARIPIRVVKNSNSVRSTRPPKRMNLRAITSTAVFQLRPPPSQGLVERRGLGVSNVPPSIGLCKLTPPSFIERIAWMAMNRAHTRRPTSMEIAWIMRMNRNKRGKESRRRSSRSLHFLILPPTRPRWRGGWISRRMSFARSKTLIWRKENGYEFCVAG